MGVDHTWTEYWTTRWTQSLRDNETGNTCEHEYVAIAQTRQMGLITTFIHNLALHGLPGEINAHQ